MSPLRGLSSQLAKEYYKLEKMKFLVYGREPLDVLEEWIRDPLLPAKPLSSSSTSTDCPILQKSQFKETMGQVEVQERSVKNILPMFTENDEGWKKHWGCLETDDEPTEEQILLRKHARAESIVH
jgi:secreted Zn-dependent insulinase-like peptidase